MTRIALTLILLTALAACLPGQTQTPPGQADPPEDEITGAGLDGEVSRAVTMTVTAYDDGQSCPGGCDAHAVFHATHNGTANAFAPGPEGQPFAPRTSGTYAACRRGEECAICFGPKTASCIVATYRGNGPPRGRIDVTPAFLKAWCGRDGLPGALASKCTTHMAAARGLARKTNCIAEPRRAGCVDVMSAARAAKAEDLPRYRQCKEVGQSAYNRTVGDPALQRHNACDYFKNVFEYNSSGDRWHRLTPAACREGYFVGRNGLDCCSADPVQAAIDPVECGLYYPG